jgi:uncharacterized protein YjbI with pentapeptide repeats
MAVNLSGAKLNSANLSSANLSGADLSGADLTGVRARVNQKPASLTQEQLDQACGTNAKVDPPLTFTTGHAPRNSDDQRARSARVAQRIRREPDPRQADLFAAAVASSTYISAAP